MATESHLCIALIVRSKAKYECASVSFLKSLSIFYLF